MSFDKSNKSESGTKLLSSKVKHGTEAGYSYGCNCDACNTAHKAYLRKHKDHFLKTGEFLSKVTQHGTEAGYSYGCECNSCIDAHIDSKKKKKEKKKKVVNVNYLDADFLQFIKQGTSLPNIESEIVKIRLERSVFELDLQLISRYYNLSKIVLNERSIQILLNCLCKALEEIEFYHVKLGLNFKPNHNGDLVIFCGGNGGLVHQLCLITQNKITFNGWLSSSVVNTSIKAMKLWCDEVMLYQRGYNLSQCKCGTSWDSVLYGVTCGVCGETNQVAKELLSKEIISQAMRGSI